MADQVNKVMKKIRGLKPVAYTVVLVLAVNGLANFTESLQKIHGFYRTLSTGFSEEQLSDAELQKKLHDTARELISFVSVRQANEPSVDFDDWESSVTRLTKYGQETRNTYLRDYAPTIVLLRDELLKRGLKHEDIDRLYEWPVNYIGLQMIALRLTEMAHKVGYTQTTDDNG